MYKRLRCALRRQDRAENWAQALAHLVLAASFALALALPLPGEDTLPEGQQVAGAARFGPAEVGDALIALQVPCGPPSAVQYALVSSRRAALHTKFSTMI